MKKIVIVTLITCMLVLGIFYAANRRSLLIDSSKVQIVASFYPLYFFATQIAGDKAIVTNITPSGAEPHDYDVSTKDIVRMEQSNLILLNGGHLEAWGEKVQENLQGSSVKVVLVGDALTTKKLRENGVSNPDPHIWLDPVLAKQEAMVIAEALEKTNPASSSFYRQREQTLATRFDQLDGAYRTGLSMCRDKDIVTSHAAFGYLAAEYGLHQIPIAGLSPDAEPSTAQLGYISQFVKLHNVRYIFFESLVSSKLANTIATETAAKTLELNPLEGLTDIDIKNGRDYFTVMYNNLGNLQRALNCEAS